MAVPSLFPILLKAQSGSVTIATPLDSPVGIEVGTDPVQLDLDQNTIDVAVSDGIAVDIQGDTIVIDVGPVETEIEV
jgi:hypothetical protein